MSTVKTQPLILVVGSRDDFLHAYRNDQELLADQPFGAGPGQLSDRIEYFDGDGRRFIGVYDQQGRLLQLRPSTDPPDLPALLQRVRNATNHLRSLIEGTPEGAEYVQSMQQAIRQLPNLNTSADLHRFLLVFVSHSKEGPPLFGPLGIDDDQPGLHNAWHRWGFR
ncbi:MAG: hypothetical protein ACRDTG_24200 [Pseudonocardiaceae bacterium]